MIKGVRYYKYSKSPEVMLQIICVDYDLRCWHIVTDKGTPKVFGIDPSNKMEFDNDPKWIELTREQVDKELFIDAI